MPFPWMILIVSRPEITALSIYWWEKLVVLLLWNQGACTNKCEENKKVYTSYINELGGNLTFTGSCNLEDENSFITKPYLKGYDIGKFVVVSNTARTIEDINKLFN